MPLPVVFAQLAQGDQPLTLLDQQFTAVAGFTVVPCKAIGQNVIALTLFLDAPVITAYTDLSPVFAFVAAQTSTGNVTINVNQLGEFPLYQAGGALVGAGQIVAGSIYTIAFLQSLQNGAGGFQLLSAGAFPVNVPGGELGVGMGIPADAQGTGVIASNLIAVPGCTIGWNYYVAVGDLPNYLVSGSAARMCFINGLWQLDISSPGNAGQEIPDINHTVATIDSTGRMTLADTLVVAHGPAPSDPDNTVATRIFVQHSIQFFSWVGPTQTPETPKAGFLWLDTSTNPPTFRVHDGTAWRTVGTVT